MKKQYLKRIIRNKRVIIFSSVIGFLLIGSLAIISFYQLKYNGDNEEVNIKETLVVNDNVFIIMDASQDISFEIINEDDFKYEVIDIDNNQVETTINEKDNKVIINGLYEYGKTYLITIENGIFTDEKFKLVKKIEFTIIDEPVNTASEEIQNIEPSKSSDNNNDSNKEDKIIELKPVSSSDVKPSKTYRYTEEQVKNKLKNNFEEMYLDDLGTQITSFAYSESIDVDNNVVTMTRRYCNPGDVTYTCSYNYVIDEEVCSDESIVLNHLRNTCQNIYQEYLNYLETGNTDNEVAENWDSFYESIDDCIVDARMFEQEFNYIESFNNTLNIAGLTKDDLEVLK